MGGAGAKALVALLVVKVTLLLYVMILYSLSAQTPNMAEIAGATKSCRQLHMTDEIQY